MAMNPYIAEMYNTNGYAEKVAQVEGIVDAFIKQASAEGLDLSGLSDDQIVDYAIDWADEQGGGSDGRDKTAEADYMGRVMAHAYVDEMNKIASDSAKFDPIGPEVDKMIKAESGPHAEATKRFQQGRKQRFIDKILPNSKQKLLGAASESDKILRPIKDFAIANRGKLLAGAGLATGLGGGLLLGRRASSSEKKSHLNELHEAAVERANELIGRARSGQSITFSKVASAGGGALDRIITELAWSMLEDEGYVR